MSKAREIAELGDTLTVDGSGNIEITGTITSDGLTVDTDVATQATALELNGTSFADTERLSIDFSRGSSQGVRLSLEPDEAQTNGDFIIETGGFGSTSDRLRIEANGDISFYEDTGTTPKFFWDASAESLGIGSTTTGGKLRIAQSSDASTGGLHIAATDGNSATIGRLTSGELTIRNNSIDTMSFKSGNVGIGTSSPSEDLHVTNSTGSSAIKVSAYGSGNNDAKLILDANGTGLCKIEADKALTFSTDAGVSERMRIDSSGNVGISTGSPQAPLEVSVSQTSDYEVARFSNGALGSSFSAGAHITIGRPDIPRNLKLGIVGNGSSEFDGYLYCTETGGALKFGTNNTERMRIDSSGNLLVGKSVASFGTAGIEIFNPSVSGGSRVNITNSGDVTLNLHRRVSDGALADFYKDNIKVGSIGANGGRPYFSGSGSGIAIGGTGAAIWPTNASGTLTDNAYDLGSTSYRFDDIYATNGTIQTSDENEKQQIASLTDAELTAAKAISKLFKTFKWNDSVAEKGDAARTHSGVIAQEVEQAMTDAGLNAGDYAFFISTTWWETQTEVPAVEAVEAVDAVYEDVIIPAVEEVLDEEGNVVTEAQPERTEQRLVSEAVEAVEGKEAYTRTDIYETAEEAPEGAVERNRKGIRYPQLLSFIGAATEQRLASIEARLDALEA